MHDYDELNSQQNLFIDSLYEPEENVLEFIIAIGSISDNEEDQFLEGTNLGPVKEISYSKNSTKYKVRFATYTCYSVLDESFAQMHGGDYEGDKIRVYSKSPFLVYSKKDTFAEQIFQDQLRHYSFLTLSHIINVISNTQPIIAKI